ncbi:phBC6A51 family helix-turn-helix protein [Rossellomorea marisflavi]|jgi:Helix-turn-helix of insertion element transposase|uniref:phBC6A51 family helix-turn-helix protein n=1 Tax=Rossellomorea marisflavi TaxID=189381 RepID=UPI0028536D00|nr:phBC6A51 family helix-turn-helix protein [Rossellomorea marisflavi]MDR4936053.1 phBC6A51 family helix-turn-helix protein [Rossellomorea marisflavi]
MTLKRLEAQHHLAIQYLAMPNHNGMTYQQIADECGVHVNSIGNWRKDPLFERELKREIVRNTQKRLPEMMQSMIDHAIKDGNAAAAKLIMTANDMLTDRVEVSQANEGGKDLADIKARLERYKRAESTTEEE